MFQMEPYLVEQVQQLSVAALLREVLLQDSVDAGVKKDVVIASHQPNLQIPRSDRVITWLFGLHNKPPLMEDVVSQSDLLVT